MDFSQLKTMVKNAGAGYYPNFPAALQAATATIGLNLVQAQPMAAPTGKMWFMDPVGGSNSILGGFGAKLVNSYVDGIGRVSQKYVLWIDYRNDPKEHPFSGIIKRNHGQDNEFKSGDMSICWVKTYEGLRKAISKYGMPLAVYINNIRPEEEKRELDCFLYMVAIVKKYKHIDMPQIFTKSGDKEVKDLLETAFAVWKDFYHNKNLGI